MKFPRQQLVVDPRIQGDLIARMAMVSIFTLFVSAVTTGAFRALFPGRQTGLFQLVPALIAFVIVLPIVVYYAVRVTNRLVAPVIRLWHLTRLVADDYRQVRPIEFREDDPWTDLAHDFNVMLARLKEQHRSELPEMAEEESAVCENAVCANAVCANAVSETGKAQEDDGPPCDASRQETTAAGRGAMA